MANILIKKQIIKLFIIIIITIWYTNSFAQISSESFETGMGIWQQSVNDHFNWTRTNAYTPSYPNTGPSTVQDGQWYIFIEADGHNDPPKEAIIEANLDFTGVMKPSISFYYNMNGDANMGILYFEYYDSKESRWEALWNAFGNQGKEWKNAKICLDILADKSAVKLRIRALTQYSNLSDIALDNIVIENFRLISTTAEDVTCNDYSNGSLTLEVAGGFKPYQYSVSNGENFISSSANSYTFENLPSAEYPIYVQDASGCVINNAISYIAEPEPMIITKVVNDAFPCYYSTNGNVTINVTGDGEPFSFSVNDGQTYQSLNYFENLLAGVYIIKVKNANGCIAGGGNFQIKAPIEIFIANVDVTNVEKCYGEKTGSIIVEAAGGTGSLQYTIDNWETYPLNEGYFLGLEGGKTYNVKVKDDNGCTKETGEIFLTQPEELIISTIEKTDIKGCYGDNSGEIKINASGGSGQISYSITSGSFFVPTNVFSNLVANTYQIQIRDSKNCNKSGGAITITQPDKLKITSVNKQDIQGCFGESNGQIIINISGGTEPFSFSINNGQTFQSSNTFENLGIGVYSPMVKDASGCTVMETDLVITQPTELSIDNVIVNNVTSCYGGNNGYINIYVTTGVPPYKYSIDNGQTFSDSYNFTNLTIGTYNVVVKDVNNCIINGEEYTLSQPTEIEIISQTASNASCFEENDAIINVTASGGTGTLLYSVDNGNSFPYYCGMPSNHQAGIYNIKVKDINNCVVTGNTITVTQPDKLLIEDVEIFDIQGCYGDHDGKIIINNIGGTPPYLYSVNGGYTKQESNVFENLPASVDYIPYVQDKNNCFYYTNSVILSSPDNLYIVSDSHTNVDYCHGTPTGSVTIDALGGTEPLSYSIDGGLTYSDNNGFFDNLFAGTYMTAVKDAHNCVGLGNLEYIIQPDTLVFDSIVYNHITCNALTDAKILIYVSGGIHPLKYSVTGGEIMLYSFQYLGLTAGVYDIVVRDVYNCELTSSVTINEPPSLFLEKVEHTDIAGCYGENTGTIDIFANGGVPELKYAYAQIPNPLIEFTTATNYTNLPAGNYYVSVKDDNGCVKSSSLFEISQANPVELNLYQTQDISCFGADNGKITLGAKGGYGDYKYSIDNGVTWTDNNVFENLKPGDYICAAKDKEDCMEEDNFITLTIKEPTKLEVAQVTKYDISCSNVNDGGIAIYGKGGTLPYQYSINQEDFSYIHIFNKLAEGIYVPQIIDQNGCIIFADTIVLTRPAVESIFTASLLEGCSPLSVKFTPQSNAFFNWEFGDEQISNFQSPTHIFTNDGSLTQEFVVKGIAQREFCTDTTEMIITVRPLPIVDFDVDMRNKIYPDTIFNIYNYSQSGLVSYNWSFGDGTLFDFQNPELHSYSTCGEYEISLSTKNIFCEKSMSLTVSISALNPEVNFNIDHNYGCTPLKIQVTNMSSQANEYVWDFGDGTEINAKDTSYIFSSPDNYIVNLTAFGDCGTKSEFAKQVTVYELPTIDFEVEPDTAVVEQSVLFLEKTSGAERFYWNFGDEQFSLEKRPFHMYMSPGTYDVTLIATSEHGCKDTLTINEAIVIADEPFIFVPTAFSPNGDNHNDYLIPLNGQIRDATILIYNRNSKLMFKGQNISDYWDGKTPTGDYAPPGVYVWKITGKYINGKPFERAGNVTLIR